MYPANIGKKIPDKPFDIFGTIKTIGLRERIHSHDQSKLQVFSRTVSYKEEIHFIIHSKLYRFLYASYMYRACDKFVTRFASKNRKKKPVF